MTQAIALARKPAPRTPAGDGATFVTFHAADKPRQTVDFVNFAGAP